MSSDQRETFLAVDVGGTKTEVAVFSNDDSSFTPVIKERYSSRQAGGIEDILSDFIETHQVDCSKISLGIAGVVGERESKVTNLPWKITKDSLLEMGFSAVTMINDMTAVAASLPLLGENDLFCLKRGSGPDESLKAVLAPGTGLGEGFLLHTGTHWHPRGTEGGHSDFAPVDEHQRELLAWMEAKSDSQVSAEMVCAGPAIPRLYDFYCAQGMKENSKLVPRLSSVDDRTPLIVEGAITGSCQVCVKTLDLFLKILGREGANLVMKLYATGGLFLGGGILPRLVGTVSLVPFLKAFHFPGPMEALLASTPIYVILRRDAALLGSASHGKRMLF